MALRARSRQKSIHSAEQKAFCEVLTVTRHQAGLTQTDVAKRLGRPQSFVAKYEGGERRVDVIEFLAIASALGADPLRLLKRIMGRVREI
jgi:transcriptional regulator with XRE-family HTH domain